MGGQKVPQQRTLFHEVMTIIAISSCFWGALFGALWWHSRRQQQRQGDERFTIKRLASRSMTQDRLPLSVLSELLDVSAKNPCSLFAIQPEIARRRLLGCPAVEQASVWRLLPGTLGVEYALRSPVAAIAGLKNIGVDRCGTVFFLFPFYAPKHLPSLVVPLPKARTLSEVQRAFRLSKEAPIGLQLLEKVQRVVGSYNIAVESLDVTRLREHSVFRREVVVVLSSLFAKDKRVYTSQSENHLYARPTPRDSADRKPANISNIGTFSIVESRERSLRCKDDSPTEMCIYLRIGARTILSNLDRLPALCDRLFKGRFRSGMVDLRYEQMAILSGEVAS